jgi:hypothetical protein
MGIIMALVFVAMVVAYVASKRPTHDREWRVDLKQLPQVERHGDEITVHNLRNTRYGSPNTPYSMSYTTRTFDLKDVSSVWFVQETFGMWRAVAHTFLSFEFADGRCVAVSLEARIPANESYSLFRGVLNSYELMVILGDEQDLIGRRAKYQAHDVYLYPLTLSQPHVQRLLGLLLQEANDVIERPRFYNTLYRSCTSHLFRFINRVSPGAVPLRLGTIVPGYSDRLLLTQGLIAHMPAGTPTNLIASSPWREAFYISDLVRDYADVHAHGEDDDAAFSRAIRQPLPRQDVLDERANAND